MVSMLVASRMSCAHHWSEVAGAVQQQARCDAACAAHPPSVPPPVGPARPRAALAPALRSSPPLNAGPVAGAGGRRARVWTPLAALSGARVTAGARAPLCTPTASPWRSWSRAGGVLRRPPRSRTRARRRRAPRTASAPAAQAQVLSNLGTNKASRLLAYCV